MNNWTIQPSMTNAIQQHYLPWILDVETKKTSYALLTAIEINDLSTINWLYNNRKAGYTTALHLLIEGETCLSKAIKLQIEDIIHTLIETGAPTNYPSIGPLNELEVPLITAMRLNLTDIIPHLIQDKSTLSPTSGRISHPLTIATSLRNLHHIQMLLNAECSLTFAHQSTGNRNPINLITHCHGKLNDNEQSIQPITPNHLHNSDFINCKRDTLITENLILSGIDVNQEDTMGKSPLYYAILFRSCMMNTVHLLIRAGANPSPRGLTILNQLIQRSLTAHYLTEGLHEILHYLNNPPRLEQLCRNSIRKQLRITFNKDFKFLKEDQNTSGPNKTKPQLPLPEPLLSYILLES